MKWQSLDITILLRTLRIYQEWNSMKKLIWETSENNQYLDQHWQLSVKMMNKTIQTSIKTVVNSVMNQLISQWSYKFKHDWQTEVNSTKTEEHVQSKETVLKRKKTLALKEVWKCYNCEKSEHLSQQCKRSHNNEKKTVTATSYNSFNWTACQNNMCRVYISDKDEAEWYSQKWQKKHRLYNITKVFMKKIVTFNWIDVEKINIHSTQKENFPEYNEEVYVFKNDEEIIEQEKA